MQTQETIQTNDTRDAMNNHGFNENFYELFQRHGTDGPSRSLAGRLQKIQAHIQQAANGGINKRRSLIKQDIAQQLNEAKQAYRSERKQFGEQLIDQAWDRAEKKVKPTAHERLADLEEAKLRAATLSDDQMVRQAQSIKDASPAKLAVSFRNRYEVDTLAARLRATGNDDLADAVSERARQVPAGLYGDEEGAGLLDAAEHYLVTQDRDAAYLRDEQGRRLAVDIDQLIDLTPLENVPE